MSSSDRVKIQSLHELLLSEQAKNITWSFIVVDFTNFREPKFVNLNIIKPIDLSVWEESIWCAVYMVSSRVICSSNRKIWFNPL